MYSKRRDVGECTLLMLGNISWKELLLLDRVNRNSCESVSDHAKLSLGMIYISKGPKTCVVISIVRVLWLWCGVGDGRGSSSSSISWRRSHTDTTTHWHNTHNLLWSQGRRHSSWFTPVIYCNLKDRCYLNLRFATIIN